MQPVVCDSHCHCQQTEGYVLTYLQECCCCCVCKCNKSDAAGSVRLMLITSNLDHFLSFEKKALVFPVYRERFGLETLWFSYEAFFFFFFLLRPRCAAAD